ncbi:D-erythronate dehydrogenase [Propionivibrio soli]|uniref:D-erythronate dehydrogenase n=1 Tax=Propionivibrio soli TaxID=2976531 RepID=UPI0021E7587F|nr:D-erythronate dehydrogenase [Propionivibrio soli]
MKVLITGGGGFLGYRLAQALLKKGTLVDVEGKQEAISQIVLFDMAFPENADTRLKCVKGDLTDRACVEATLGGDTNAVFHLASVVSGGAEADFDLGMRVNLDGTRGLLDACRKQAKPPRFVFTSSVAVFGGELPEVLDDSTTPNPQGSYGAQKVCCEYLVTDYSRKGYIDGRSLRLPTISVRPGKPNLAASSFASGIIREPLNGAVSVCPVGRDARIWLLSPGKVIEALIHAYELPSSTWGVKRVVNLPGNTASVGEMIDTLRRIAGDKVADLIQIKPDPRIEALVLSWPARFRNDRAHQLGFSADKDVESIIRAYISDQRIKV